MTELEERRRVMEEDDGEESPAVVTLTLTLTVLRSRIPMIIVLLCMNEL